MAYSRLINIRCTRVPEQCTENWTGLIAYNWMFWNIQLYAILSLYLMRERLGAGYDKENSGH